ncbi:MAG: hypothetical protein AAFY71_26345 [Bacteroidota bacterium]
MKRVSIISVFICIGMAIFMFFSSQMAIANEPIGPSYDAIWEAQPAKDSSLVNIQDRIYQSFVQSFIQQQEQPISEIITELAVLDKEKNQKLIRYWMSYAEYYHSIFHLQNDNKEAAKKACMSSLGRLEKLKGKNSEDYALLAMVQSFAIQFVSPMKAPFISSKVKKYAEKAISIDDQNPRAYYVLGSNDYYTPEQYGGGKKVVEYLSKAIDLPEQAVSNPYLPSWGKQEAYEMIVKFFIKKEQWEEAKQYFQQGVEAYPENYQLNKLASKLVGK